MAGSRFCLNHKDRSAVAQCHQCHKPVCAECLVDQDGGKFCSPPCAARNREFKTSYKEPNIKEGFNLVGKLVGLVLLAVVFLGVAWVGNNVLGIGFFANYDYLGKWMGKKAKAAPEPPANTEPGK